MLKKCKCKKTKKREIDIDQILLKDRQIFLYDEIDDELAQNIVKQLLALDNLYNTPIALLINSPGGSVSCGFSIIDTMKNIKSSVGTIICGEACSMAGIISVAGDKRFMTEHSVWMSHDLAGGIRGDYTTKVLDRANYLKQEQKRLREFLGKHTKLSNEELIKSEHGELWLYPKACLEKGIIDIII